MGDIFPHPFTRAQPLWDRVIEATDNAKKKGALFSMDNAPRIVQDGPIKVTCPRPPRNIPILLRGISPFR